MKQWFADRILRRMLKNISWLLSGRVVTGLTGFIYLSIVTHRLGLETFGILVIIQTYVKIIATLTTFQSSQAVIRYGAIFLERKDKKKLQQLIKFTTLLDVFGASMGIALAVILAPIIFSHLGWQPHLIVWVQLCSLTILFTTVATPRGLLQLYNRFDLVTFDLTITHVVQLLGTIVAAVCNTTLWGYLGAWFFARLVRGILVISLGWREVWKQGMLQDFNGSIDQLFQSHPDLWRFCVASNFDSSLPMIFQEMSPIAITWLSTSANVGLFRIGSELASPLGGIAGLLTLSLYPELAHLNTQQNWQKFKALVLRITKVSMGVGLALFLVYIFLGKQILFYGFGDEFTEAYSLLLILVISETFLMGNCALEPSLYALGCPNLALRVKGIAIFCLYIPVVIVLTKKFGAMGAGMASLMCTSFILLLNSIITRLQLQEKEKN
ncbi:MAG: oligosaccharide flippase family protein [Moorea sp. SIO2B7]|nr:oligosaccharide flippase family protein [Moorena sp. SIO2B7]